MTGKGRLSPREMTVLAMLGALMSALQMAMASLPNIHPVAVLVIAAALCFSWRALYAVAVFVLSQGLLHGFGLWWLSYVYVWPLLVILVVALRKNASTLFWAAVAGGFGLCFGALCALPYFLMGGWSLAISYWLSGIPFDLLHALGNFVLTLALLRPLCRAIEHVCPSGR